jgi:heme-degrading monooxygenase HmoA
MKRLYRIDKFIVPAAARAEFLPRVWKTHALLRKQPGFVRDHILEHTDTAPGQHIVLTFAEWESEEAVQNARAAVQAMYAQEGFNPHELLARLGIQADLGYYQEISA